MFHINYPALRAPVEGYAFFSSSLGIVKASFASALVHSSNLKIRRGVNIVRHRGATNITNNGKMSSYSSRINIYIIAILMASQDVNYHS